MRGARVLAVAWRDLRQVHAGKGWWRLPLIALALLLPVGALPLENPLAERPVRARGEIPEALADRIEHGPRAPIALRGEAPVAVVGTQVPEGLRQVLDTLPGEPSVRIERRGRVRELPGRSLLVALLAISLLTGPLAESLPGERKRGTLETLLTAGVSRLEVVVGKWLGWTAAASATVLLVAAAGLLDGSQAPGWWPLGLPLCAGAAVALGLWLGRSAADEVAGAARTMRIVPLAALGLGVTAWLLADLHPALGAAVPMGGALLVAGDLLHGPGPLLAATAGTALGTVALLAHTARGLSEVGLRRPRRPTAGLVATAALVWAVPVAGPALWTAAGNASFAANLDADVGAAVGGGLLASLAIVEHLRSRRGLERPRLDGWLAGLTCGAALAMAAAASSYVPWPELALLAELRVRMAAALAPGHAPLAAVVVVLGHELLFRGVLQRRLGLGWTAGLYVLLVSPLDPLRGAVAALALGLLAKRRGLLAAVLAHLAWALAPEQLSLPQPGLALACAALALGVAAMPRLSERLEERLARRRKRS